ncbi:ankyrin repeat protein [Apiospora arundinis]|uniref:Ankyrin repeat protein n=1 Tax=Apiospora arundinis TaxID=335852 RepID=A0ABR2JC84_9PEZI
MNVWLVISGIEHADEDFAWFIQQVGQLGNHLEIPLQIIITSNGDGKIMEQMATFTNFNISGCPIIQQLRHDELMWKTITSRRDWEELSRSWPGVELAAPKVLDVYDSDPQLAGMALQWIGNYIRLVNLPHEWEEKLEDILHFSPPELFKSAQDCIPLEQLKIAKEVSIIVRTSFRPLTVEEIASALLFKIFSFGSSRGQAEEHARFVTRIHHIIPASFTIQHGEVHFAHDSIMQYEEPEIFLSESSRHASMTSMCLGFLQSATAWNLVADVLEERTEDHIQTSESRKDFLAYAANHVIAHYNLSGGEVPIRDLLSFFRVPQARQRWWQALNALGGSRACNPCPIDPSIIQCVAQTGIVDLVVAVMPKDLHERHTRDFQLECVRAITEAASESISAAASHGDKSCLNLLIDFCSKSESFDWPESILYRAAWLGFSDVVQKLLRIGLAQGWKFEPEFALSLRELTKLEVGSLDSKEQLLTSCLAIALRFGHSRVVQVVLDAHETEFPPDTSKLLLEQAVSRGDPEIIRLLIEHSVREMDCATENDLLLVAANSSSFRAIETLIKASRDLSWHVSSLIESYAVSPLLYAIDQGYTKCVEHLLRSDVDVNATHDGKTALGESVKHKRLQLAQMIIAAGGDPNITSDNRHPLTMAVENGDKEMVELLLDNRANIEAQVDQGWYKTETALTIAAGSENKEVIRTLLQRGAQVNYDSPKFASPLYVAAFEKHLENVKIFLEHGAEPDDRAREPGDPTPLNEVYADAAIVKTLLDYKADINYRSAYGTVLYRASKHGYLETVQALLSREVKPDLELEPPLKGSEDDSLTPLCAACKNGHTGVMRALLEAGANARHKARHLLGLTPLHICFGFTVEKGPDPHWPLLTLLLYGSRLDLNEVDALGRTALHLISKATPVSLVAALVNAGASTDVSDNRGHTPLERAVVSGNIEVYEYLAARPRDDPAISPLRLACAVGNETMVEHLVKTGADVNEIDKVTGETPLYALFTGPGAYSDLVRFLVQDCGADVGRPGGEFKYPIIKAFTCQVDDCEDYSEKKQRVARIHNNIRLLHRHGADIDAADDAGRRAVHVALSSLSPTVPWGIFQELKADLSARDRLGRSALHYAAALGLPSDIRCVAAFPGVDVNDVDVDGWSPLMWAVQQRRPEFFHEIMTQLIDERGADLWVKAAIDRTIWTPLKLARFQGCYSDDEVRRLKPSERTRERRHGDKFVDIWDDGIHESEMGGTYNLCWRCYPHRGILHQYHPHFEEWGFMHEENIINGFGVQGLDIEGVDIDATLEGILGNVEEIDEEF